MKYEEIIAEARELYSNEYSDSQILKWIKEAEDTAAIYRGDTAASEINISDNSQIGPPFDRMYIDFVMAQVSFHQHDDESYMKYINMFNARFSDWKNYFVANTPMAKKQYTNWFSGGAKSVSPLDN